jgi:hypothetical protein
VRTRLIVAFIVVVMLAAIPEAWLISLIFRWQESREAPADQPPHSRGNSKKQRAGS